MNRKSQKFIDWTGTKNPEIFAAGSGSDVLRGLGGNDTLTGLAGSDRFVFEATLADNGVDTITDLSPKKSKKNKSDILDLSEALSGDISKKNIKDYVNIADGRLLVRPAGKGSWETWAMLTGIKKGDKVEIRTSAFDTWIKAGVSSGDSSPPVFDPNADYTLEYDENQLIGAVIGTVVGASDADGGVTQYRFVQSSNSESPDGYFEIDNTGKITLTKKGWSATVNDYDDAQISFDYYIEAGDAAGNWSLPQQITLRIQDIVQGSGKSFYLSLDRAGVWFDSDEDGKRDGSEISATLVAAGDLWRIKDVDMEADNVQLRIVDGIAAQTLDLKGFGSGDKLIIDYNTNKNDWYGMAPTMWWKLNSRPELQPTNFNRLWNQLSAYSFANGRLGTLVTYARWGPKIAGVIGTIDYFHYAQFQAKGTSVNGWLQRYFGANSYAKYDSKNISSVTNLAPFPKMTYLGATFGSIQTTNTYSLVKGLGNGHAVEVIQPRFSVTISIGRNGAWIDANANGVQDGSEAFLTTTTSNGYDLLNGIDFAKGTYDIRFVDAYNIPKFDLTGFDGDDKIIIDLVTSQADWMNVKAWFTTNAKTSPVPVPTASVGLSKYASLVKNNAGPNYNLSFYPSAKGTYSVLGRQAYGPTVNGVGRYITSKPNGGIAFSIAKIDLGSNFEVILA